MFAAVADVQGLRAAFYKVWSSFTNQRPFPATREVPSSLRCQCRGAQLPAQHQPLLWRAKLWHEPECA